MKLIELCKYTTRQSQSDTGAYYEPFKTAQELIDNLNKNGGK